MYYRLSMYSDKKPQAKGKGLFLLFAITLLFLVGAYLGLNSVQRWLYSANQKARPDVGASLGIVAQNQTSPNSIPGQVLAVEDEISENSLVFRLPVFFTDLIHASSATFDIDLEVGNDVEVGNDLTVGNNVSVGNSLTVANDLTVDGTLITAEGITAPNVIYSILAGDGISVAGVQDITITNSDPGSSQEIFKNFEFDDDTITAGDNDATLRFESGSGISFSTSGNTVTVSASGAALNVSGWTDDGTVVRLTTSTDNVGIGTTSPTAKLHVVGTGLISGATTLSGGLTVSSGINNSSGGITNAGSITGATGLTSSGTITFSSFGVGI